MDKIITAMNTITKTKSVSVFATVEKIDSGYSAFIEHESGLITTSGKTLYDLRKNLDEAIALHLEQATEDGLNVSGIINAKVDLRLDVAQFFEYFSTINQTAFADYIGMNRSVLNMYITGKRMPSEKQSLKILAGIHKLGKEYLATSF